MEKIMEYSSTLPENFDGIFRVTNWTDEDFIGRWGSKDYLFPAKSTSPMIIINQTPLEIQQIRKKFAKDLAEREFGKGTAYANLMKQERNSDGTPRLNSIMQAGTYSVNDMTALIQKCLEPLPVGKAKVTETKKEKLEDKLSRNDDGNLNTEVVDSKKSLRKKALEA